MKVTAFTGLFLAASLTVHAQGKVSFGNDSNHYFVLRDPLLGIVALPVSPLPDGSTLYAALYAGNGTAGNNLTLATRYAWDAAGVLTAGRMVTHGVAIPGLIGGQVDTLAVVIDDRAGAIGSAYPTFYEAAASGCRWYGTSGLFQMTPGTSLSYPSITGGGGSTWAPANLVVYPTPEPSTLALAGLGALLMMFSRRRRAAKPTAVKAWLLTLPVTLACSAAFGQGKVSFGNDSNHYFVLGDTPAADSAVGGGTTNIAGNTVSGAPGAIPVSPLPSGYTLIAALYAGNGTSGNNLILATSYALDATGWLTVGRMVTHGLAISGLTGGQIDTLAVVVGDRVGPIGSAYPTLMDVDAQGYVYYGTSGLFTMTPGTSLTYPSITGGGGSTWAPANLVIYAGPEPSTLALGGLGAVLMVSFRRRKQ